MLSRHSLFAVCFLAASSAAKPFASLSVVGNAGVFPSGTAGSTATGTIGTTSPTGTGTSPRAPKLGGVAGYFGQTGGNLSEACSGDAYSTIILAFVDKYFANGGWPALNLGASTMGPSTAQKSAGATNLTDGTNLVPAIKQCQAAGKKVFISIGGENGLTNFTSEAEGAQFASTLWDLFLGGSNATARPLRPFGDVVLDGVDIDNETHNRTGYLGLVSGLRQRFATNTSRPYWISAAPQCPRNGGSGDSSLSDEVLQQVDMAWVQFYNNEEALCNHGQSGFIQAVQSWAKAIAPAQLWIGAPGDNSTSSATNGYANTSVMQQEVQQIFQLNSTNIGGWMLWDVATAANNSNYQDQVAAAIKQDNSTTNSTRRMRN